MKSKEKLKISNRNSLKLTQLISKKKKMNSTNISQLKKKVVNKMHIEKK